METVDFDLHFHIGFTFASAFSIVQRLSTPTKPPDCRPPSPSPIAIARRWPRASMSTSRRDYQNVSAVDLDDDDDDDLIDPDDGSSPLPPQSPTQPIQL